MAILLQLQEQPNNEDVLYQYSKIQPAREQLALVQDLINHRSEYNTAITLLTQLLEISPWSISLREKRADCYIQDQDILSAVSDLRSVNRLTQDSTAGYFKLSLLLYQLGHATDALKVSFEYKNFFFFN